MSALAHRTRTRVAQPAALLALCTASLVLRTRAIDAGYWIDEGLSLGIAAHPLRDIPGLLGQDGSPPLYYLLLSGWTWLAGSGEAATRVLSLLAALATIPAALWAGRALFGERAGWTAAAVAATLPLLTAYAQETRMYALLALLSLLVSATFVLAFVRGQRRSLVAFVVLAVLLIYTHNWALFLLLGLASALPIAARARGARPVVRDAALAAFALAVAYAPWLPTLLDQARHTGAPWSTTPDLAGLLNPLSVPLGEGLVAVLVIVAAGAGLLRSRQHGPELLVLVVALVIAGAAAWTGAQLEPGWADRYMTVFVGPVVLLAGAGLAAARRAGLVVLAVALLFWALDQPQAEKSNVREVAHAGARLVRPGDLVVLTHPEQVAVFQHYSPPGLRWATALGAVRDPRVFDWRDAAERLRAAEPRRTLDALLAGPRPARLVLVRPAPLERGGPEWLDLVARRAADWDALTAGDPRLRRIALLPAGPPPEGSADVQAVVFEVRAP